MLTGPRTGGRRPQLPFATAAPGAESPGVTRLSGIVTSTAPACPRVIFARMITRQLAVTQTAGRGTSGLPVGPGLTPLTAPTPQEAHHET
jgi:hypothetical protein